MKRLTIYLLIVLSLSITVNSKVNAAYLYLETKGWFNLKYHKNLEDFLKDYPRPRFENSNKIAGYHNVGKKSTCKDLISLTIKRYTKNIYKICIDENGKDTELYKKLLKYSKKGMCFTHDKRLGKYCRRMLRNYS